MRRRRSKRIRDQFSADSSLAGTLGEAALFLTPVTLPWAVTDTIYNYLTAPSGDPSLVQQTGQVLGGAGQGAIQAIQPAPIVPPTPLTVSQSLSPANWPTWVKATVGGAVVLTAVVTGSSLALGIARKLHLIL